MTKKLYDEDSHIQVFEARVLSCLPAENGYRVVLDQTAFFAEGGGQPADRGILNGQSVRDVQEEGGDVYHMIDHPIACGSAVTGQIDWAFRYDYMQQHSGEHILSGLAYAWKGVHNVGFHMNEAITTVDFDGVFTPEELTELERRANAAIYENLPITVSYPSSEELDRMEYRSKKKLTGAVRIVKVGDADCCACCAPHVRRTGEIGQIKIVSAESYKGGVRLTILCGQRALADYTFKSRLLKELGGTLSVKAEEVGKAVEKQSGEIERLKEQVAALSKELIECRLQELSEQTSVCLIENNLDMVAARSLVNRLTAQLPGYGAVLLPKKGTEETYQYLIGSLNKDVRPLAKELAQRFGGRGGGSAQMVQGTVTGQAAAIAAFLQEA